MKIKLEEQTASNLSRVLERPFKEVAYALSLGNKMASRVLGITPEECLELRKSLLGSLQQGENSLETSLVVQPNRLLDKNNQIFSQPFFNLPSNLNNQPTNISNNFIPLVDSIQNLSMNRFPNVHMNQPQNVQFSGGNYSMPNQNISYKMTPSNIPLQNSNTQGYPQNPNMNPFNFSGENRNTFFPNNNGEMNPGMSNGLQSNLQHITLQFGFGGPK